MEHEEKIKETFRLFLTKEIPQDLFNSYINDSFGEHDGEGFSKLQDFVVDNLKKEISWSTAIGVIEAVEHIYNEAISNGNLR
jgi:hypothetical protein